MNQYLPFLPIASYTSTGVGFLIWFAYQSKATSFTGEACETNYLLVRMESCCMEDLLNSSVALFAVIMQVATWYLCPSGRCVGVRQAMALIGDARQATRERKTGPVETRLTGPAATALLITLKYYKVISNPQIFGRLKAIVKGMHLQDTRDMRKVATNIV